jgi:sulfur carrier protein
MRITCNGQPQELNPGSTISALLEALRLRGPVAVEVNLNVAPRERHGQWVLHEGDQVEIVTLVGGG